MNGEKANLIIMRYAFSILHLLRGCSSAGRAPALQAGGHGFESHHLHQVKNGVLRIDLKKVGFEVGAVVNDS